MTWTAPASNPDGRLSSSCWQSSDIGVVTLLLLEGATPATATLSGIGTLAAAAMKFVHWLIA